MTIIIDTEKPLLLKPKLVDNKELLKKYIKQQIKPIIKELNIKSLRDFVVVDSLDGAEGEMIPSVFNGLPVENVHIIWENIFGLQKIGLHDHAYSVIYHELCHCRVYEDLCSKIDFNILPNIQSEETNVYGLYLSLGLRFWSEYCAYRMCAKTMQKSEIDYKGIIEKYDKATDSLQNFAFKYSEASDNEYYYMSKTDIYSFVYSIIKLLGLNHHFTNSTVHELVCKPFADKKEIVEYFDNIDSFLFQSFNNIPNCISSDMLIKLGIRIFTLYNLHGIFLNDKVFKPISFNIVSH